MKRIRVENVSHSFPETEVFRDLSFSVDSREFVSILGQSGCGKSTLLHVISGVIAPDSGRVFLDEEDITSRPGLVSYMPQNDLLLPWKTVLRNIGLPLSLKGRKAREAAAAVEPYLALFGLEGFEHRYPAQLSGGMRQRAALLRTYLHRTDIMLLDEPFGALDAITRERLQEWLTRLLETLRTTVLLVTHDIDEAILLSDRIIVLSPRPARIAEILPVDLPRPRNGEQKLSPEFLKLKKRALHALE
ncbi:MAG: ABC transporter ATP-binding protein [Spirochaetales bacterium]|nr:ABC transporter ATP-binding protein [Spirochaetales bacterium]